jgi:hypothetical protein
MGHTPDESRCDWVACHHHDRNVARGILGRINRRGLYGDDDVDLTANQSGRQFGEPSELALRRSDVDLNILPISMAKIAERLAKWPHGFWATNEENADARQTPALLP